VHGRLRQQHAVFTQIYAPLTIDLYMRSIRLLLVLMLHIASLNGSLVWIYKQMAGNIVFR